MLTRLLFVRLMVCTVLSFPFFQPEEDRKLRDILGMSNPSKEYTTLCNALHVMSVKAQAYVAKQNLSSCMHAVELMDIDCQTEAFRQSSMPNRTTDMLGDGSVLPQC